MAVTNPRSIIYYFYLIIIVGVDCGCRGEQIILEPLFGFERISPFRTAFYVFLGKIFRTFAITNIVLDVIIYLKFKNVENYRPYSFLAPSVPGVST